MKNRADKRAEKQPVYDKVSSYFSTAFGSKYYRNGECVVEIGAKFLAGETHATVRSKKNMELALNMVVD